MASDLALKALSHAIDEIGVREDGGPNRGPEVDVYLRAVGLDPARDSYPWCAAFVFWCYQRAAGNLKAPLTLPRTASVRKLLEASTGQRTQFPQRGAIFVQDHGSGRGHCGLVLDVGGRTIVTVEGNTNDDGSREGIGVFLRTRHNHDVTTYLVY